MMAAMRLSQRQTRIEGIHYRTGLPVSVSVHDGRIQDIRPLTVDCKEALPLIGPGLVDLQVNGYGGMDFNTLPLAEETVHRLTRSLWREGVTSYFPTVITNSAEAIEEIMSVLRKSCESDTETRSCIAGIHLEGPFISPEDGPRGAHPKRHVIPPSWPCFQKWQEASGGSIKIVTLSPEWPDAPDFIAKCTEHGVVVSIGHTAASEAQIVAAAAAGARMSTHLGNGAHPMLPRHPNYLWSQLAHDDLWASLIADGFHLPESFLKVVMRVKGEKAMLVSDAVSLSGMPPGEYEFHIGGKVVLTPQGKLHLSEHPNMLAGSAQMLVHGMEHLVKRGLCDLCEAWEMASIRPAALMRLPSQAGLEAGAPADLTLIRRDGLKLRVVETYKSGMRVYTHENAQEIVQETRFSGEDGSGEPG